MIEHSIYGDINVNTTLLIILMGRYDDDDPSDDRCMDHKKDYLFHEQYHQSYFTGFSFSFACISSSMQLAL